MAYILIHFIENFMENNKHLPEKNSALDKENENIAAAEEAAEHDIDMDPELSLEPEPGDDLDEGELANFESDDDGEDEDE